MLSVTDVTSPLIKVANDTLVSLVNLEKEMIALKTENADLRTKVAYPTPVRIPETELSAVLKRLGNLFPQAAAIKTATSALSQDPINGLLQLAHAALDCADEANLKSATYQGDLVNVAPISAKKRDQGINDNWFYNTDHRRF